MSVTILVGDVREKLETLADNSIHCCVTSPPYFGLRDYGVEGQIGLEASPAEFIAVMTEVFEEVRRVLRPDGTCWINMGDSYAGSWGSQGRDYSGVGVSALSARQVMASQRKASGTGSVKQSGLKPKDLMMMPHRLAIALQDAGWWVRQDIVWHKPNPMPESVRDRCTKAHEYIFLLTKSERYYFDAEAIKEPCSDGTHPRRAGNGVGFGHGYDPEPKERVKTPSGWDTGPGDHRNLRGRHVPGNKSHKGTTAYEAGATEHRTKAGLVAYAEKMRKLAEAGSGVKNNSSFDAAMEIMPDVRNKRSVWTMPTQPFKEAHFATFPTELPETCIKAGCPVGGIVLDPFFGAGTTGLVADRLQRDCIGIELNPAYAEMARKRIQADSTLLTEVRIAA